MRRTSTPCTFGIWMSTGLRLRTAGVAEALVRPTERGGGRQRIVAGHGPFDLLQPFGGRQTEQQLFQRCAVDGPTQVRRRSGRQCDGTISNHGGRRGVHHRGADQVRVAAGGFAGGVPTILSMDSEDENRVFNLRIEKSGFLSFSQFSGISVRGGGLATIPVTGPHAINTRDWFHVAVTYDGREGSAGESEILLDAHHPGLGEGESVGQRISCRGPVHRPGRFRDRQHRAHGTRKEECNPFPGLIDEVRISGVARPAHDFLFVTPEAKARAATENGEEPTPPGFQLALQEVAIGGLRLHCRKVRLLWSLIRATIAWTSISVWRRVSIRRSGGALLPRGHRRPLAACGPGHAAHL